MATTTHIIAPPRVPRPLELWHLLSLDAPTVAALWTYFIGRASHTQLPPVLPVAMFLAVWVLYAVDRLLDARELHILPQHRRSELEARHLFHFRHRRAFLAIIPLAGVAVAALLPDLLRETLRLYLIEGALLAGWFFLVHGTRSRLPKELVVGLYFAAATFTPVLVRRPQHVAARLACAILFAAVCSLNCFFIRAWERNATDVRGLFACATVLMLTSFALAASSVVTIPIGVSAALLCLLHLRRYQLSRTHLRCAADLALLTPALLLPFLR